MKHPSDTSHLEFAAFSGHLRVMQVCLSLILLAASCSAQQPFGNWRLNVRRSTFGTAVPKLLTLRIEPHPRGEVLTLDRTELDGRASTTSTILYLDGNGRDSDAGCLGTQSSRRLDDRTVEIVLSCAGGEWSRVVRRLAPDEKELMLEITERRPHGQQFEERLVFERASRLGANNVQ